MKKNLLSGLVLLLPIALTLWIIQFLVELLTAPFLGPVQQTLSFFAEIYAINLHKHPAVALFFSRVVVLIFLFFFVAFLGFLAQRIFFKWIVKITHLLLLKIPLINSIYRICRDIILAILADNKNFFSRVVAVPFPSATSRSLGFVIGDAPQSVQKICIGDPTKESRIKVVFTPSSPHPTSAFLLLVDNDQLTTLNFSIEDGFKFLISCGIFVPPAEKMRSDEQHKTETGDLSTSTLSGGEVEENIADLSKNGEGKATSSDQNGE